LYQVNRLKKFIQLHYVLVKSERSQADTKRAIVYIDFENTALYKCISLLVKPYSVFKKNKAPLPVLHCLEHKSHQ
jgi:hypothetical protein